MNIVFSAIFACLTVFFLYVNGLGVLIEKNFYTSLFAFDILFFPVLSAFTPIASAYVLKTDKHQKVALALNVLLLLYVVAIAIYAFTEPKSMGKKMLQVKFFGYLFIYVIPSIINIRALAKMGK
jgi:hypothetical protein